MSEEHSVKGEEEPLLPSTPVAPSVGSFFERLARDRSSLNALVLREFTDRGMFKRTVRCQVGTITVVGRETFRFFRDAVREAQLEAKPLEIRFGPNALLPSEVLFADSGDLLWRESTVEDVLDISGVPEIVAQRALAALDLTSVSATSPRDLKEGDAKKLAILCSLYARARVLAFESPFAGLSAAAAEYLGAQLIERIQHSEQVFIIGECERFPQAWRRASTVRQLRRETKLRRIIQTLLGEVEVPAAELGRVTDLKGGELPESSESEFLITYPQLVPKPIARAEVNEELKRELIQNPALDIQDGAEQGSVTAQRRRSKNKLTRVSLVMRIVRQNPLFNLLFGFKSSLSGAMSEAELQRASLSSEAKLEVARQRQRVRHIELTLAFAIFTYCLMYLLAR